MKNIYNCCIVAPMKPNMPWEIEDRFRKGILQIGGHSGADIVIDSTPAPAMESLTPWTKVCWIRNNILDGHWDDHQSLIEKYKYLLWIDADVIEMPPTLLEDLVKINPDGVTAPFIGIETNDVFYDWAAFIKVGCDHISPQDRRHLGQRNIGTKPPYFDGSENETSEWDCVGTVTLVNTDIYKAGARYEDHPSFTDHYPICKKARDMGRKVMMANKVVVKHAFLPNYGIAWH